MSKMAQLKVVGGRQMVCFPDGAQFYLMKNAQKYAKRKGFVVPRTNPAASCRAYHPEAAYAAAALVDALDTALRDLDDWKGPSESERDTIAALKRSLEAKGAEGDAVGVLADALVVVDVVREAARPYYEVY